MSVAVLFLLAKFMLWGEVLAVTGAVVWLFVSQVRVKPNQSVVALP